MGHGVSAAAWAGTASNAAKLAAKNLDYARSRNNNAAFEVTDSLTMARNYLTQASEELDEILAEVACR